jgi:hypothetical protein
MGKERENDRAEETEEENRKRNREGGETLGGKISKKERMIGRKQKKKMGKGYRE